MKVEILQPQAYCSGVNNAIRMAKQAKQENPNKEVYVLGMLVHNNYVVRHLEDAGIRTVDNIEEIPNGQVIIFTAHGHKEALDAIAKDKKLKVYDLVCPKVLHNINLIKENLSKGHQIIYIGQQGHPEAEAFLSLSKNVILFHKNILKNYQSLFDDSPLVINQTTMNILDLDGIHKEILEVLPHARIVDEICGTTRLRQEAVKNISKDVDLIIVIGDMKSSNTKRLLEIAKQCHPQIESVMISDADELDKVNWQNKNHIVISSGASTPQEIIDAVYNKLAS